MKNVKKPGLAPTPPFGWNSWDCFGASVTEDEVIANAEYMARNLREHGWQYVVIDAAWYVPSARESVYPPFDPVEMDEWGRFVPSIQRFPSATGGAGFRPLADRIHALGLRFGLHMMRGVPRLAAHLRRPIKGADGILVSDIANPHDTCPWNADMYGLLPDAPGGQQWYDSLFALLAEWHVDYVKLDDITNPYHRSEIEMAGRAAAGCGRDIVLSLSPGPAPVEETEHLAAHAHLWRISADFWDRWPDLLAMFGRVEAWQGRVGPDRFPDADMLPLGHIGIRTNEFLLGGDRGSAFTPDERRTLLSLWCLARSPLMIGGHLPDTDEGTLQLLTNEAVLALATDGRGSREVWRRDPAIAWVSYLGPDCVVGLFNVGETDMPVSIALAEVGLAHASTYDVEDLWDKTTHRHVGPELVAHVPPHGCRLLRLRKVRTRPDET